MGKYLKMSLAIAILLCSRNLYAQQQDTSKQQLGENVDWEGYAHDTTLTFQQIVTACDSMFALEGVGVKDTTTKDDSLSTEADTAGMENDNSSYASYCKWRSFWMTRLDATTGKIYGLGKILALKTMQSPYYADCQETSPLQSGFGYAHPGDRRIAI